MKKLLVFLLTATMLFAFAACGNTQTDDADENEMATAIEIMSDPLYDLDAGHYTEVDAESAEAGLMEGDTLLKGYSDNDGLVDVLSFTTEKNDQTLEEYVTANAKTYSACYELSDFYGTQLGLCGFLDEKNGEKFYIKLYTIDDGEKFIQKLFCYHTEEMQIGDSDYYFYLPKAMEKTENESESAILGDSFVGSYAPTVDGLCTIDLYAIPQNTISYETEKSIWSEYDFTMVPEEQFNAWLKDGFTLDELDEYYTTLFGEDLGDHLNYANKNGIDLSIKEIFVDTDNGKQTELSILWLDENTVYEIYMTAPTEKWPNIGEAVGNSVHTK